MDTTPQPIEQPLTDSAAGPLTEQGIRRLRALADGNGLSPAALALVGTQEKTYVLKGIVSLSPVFDKQSVRYAGPVRGSDRKIMSNFGEIKQEVHRREQEFKQDSSWANAAKNELAQSEGYGWGLNDADITFPDKVVVLAASESCPNCRGQKQITCGQCSGQGTTTCLQCGGSRQEPCYSCGGSGGNPNIPGQVCATCNGMRFAPCRYCTGLGYTTCPTCKGLRGTSCPSCNGSGQLSEETAVGVNVKTHFRLIVEDLPSGLRRGLDRLGIAHLAKGHADITMTDAPTAENEPLYPEADLRRMMPKEDPDATSKPKNPEINYQALLPYADVRFRIGDGRVQQFSVFGKRCALLTVPTFLDTALEPARDMLKQAAEGQGGDPFTAALQARAVRQALELVLTGNRKKDALRKYYPVAMSRDVMQEILQNMLVAIKRMTLKVRAATAVTATLFSGLSFGALFLTPLHQTLSESLNLATQAVSDLVVLAGFMAASWGVLGLVVAHMLRRRFPDIRISYIQNNGKIGWSMLAGILMFFLAILAMAPVKPAWLLAMASH